MTDKKRLGSDPFSFIKDTTSNHFSDDQEKHDEPVCNNAADVKDNNGNNEKKIHITSNELNNNRVNTVLDGEITIYSVPEITTSLIDSINNYSELEIDLSKAAKIDTAGFQLLLAAKKETINKNKTLEFITPNNEIKQIFNLYGEEKLLQGEL